VSAGAPPNEWEHTHYEYRTMVTITEDTLKVVNASDDGQMANAE
jgi:hypothetical protein